jgi:hypothetical protein
MNKDGQAPSVENSVNSIPSTRLLDHSTWGYDTAIICCKIEPQGGTFQNGISLPEEFQPSSDDVICGRGKAARNHQGNRYLRSLIEDAVGRYETARNRMEKTVLVTEIIDKIRSKGRGATFVKQVGGRWYEVCDDLAREKVGQSLREKLHMKYKSSTKAKRRVKKLIDETKSGQLTHAMERKFFMATSLCHLSGSLVGPGDHGSHHKREFWNFMESEYWPTTTILPYEGNDQLPSRLALAQKAREPSEEE